MLFQQSFLSKLFSVVVLVSLFLVNKTALAQVKVGDNVKEVHPHAIFEIESTTGGVLLPRMTTEQRDAAFTENLPNGLLIFNTTENCVQLYQTTTSSWDCLIVKTTPLKAGKLLLKDNILMLNEHSVDLSDFRKDAQKLSVTAGTESSSVITLENGNAVTLQAGDYISLSESDNTITIRAQPTSVESLTASLSLQFEPKTNELRLLGTPARVNLSVLANTDSQTLHLKDNVLSISGTNSVTLPIKTAGASGTASLTLEFDAKTRELSLKGTDSKVNLNVLANTDSQTLSLKDNVLSISGANSITLPEQKAAVSLSFKNTTSNTTEIEMSDDKSLQFTASGNLNFIQLSETHLELQVPHEDDHFDDQDNVRIGTGALESNTTGSQNVAIGKSTLLKNTTGNNNIAVGNQALETNITNNDNTAIGGFALQNNTGQGNTAVGTFSGYVNRSGNLNTLIGFNANTPLSIDFDGSIIEDPLTNATAIGANAIVARSNSIQLGSQEVTLVQTSGVVSAKGFRGDASELTNLPTKYNHLYLSQALAFESASVLGRVKAAAGIYAAETSSPTAGTLELTAFDSLGNETTLSPHNFSLIGTAPEDMAWSFYSKNIQKGKQINVDMMQTVRLVEQLTGQKLIYIANLNGEPLNTLPEQKTTRLELQIQRLEKENSLLKAQLDTLLERMQRLEKRF